MAKGVIKYEKTNLPPFLWEGDREAVEGVCMDEGHSPSQLR